MFSVSPTVVSNGRKKNFFSLSSFVILNEFSSFGKNNFLMTLGQLAEKMQKKKSVLNGIVQNEKELWTVLIVNE